MDKSLEEQEEEILFSIEEKRRRGERISLLDFVPEHRKILSNTTYGLWIPPGSIETMLKRPVRNLANMLDRGMPVPSVLLVPLFSLRDKREFIYSYGLVPERGGISYNSFLQAVRDGRIIPFLVENPAFYKADFYKEIFKACEESENPFFPSFWPQRISSFMEREANNRYSMESLRRRAERILSDEKAELIRREYRSLRGEEKGHIVKDISIFAHDLYSFGFSSLADLCIDLLERTHYGYHALRCYYDYLVSGYTEGLGGMRIYDRESARNMMLLGITKDADKIGRNVNDLIWASPAGLSVVGEEARLPVVIKFDEDDARKCMERERDKELEETMLNLIRGFHEYDFRKFVEESERMNEILRRVGEETKEYYKRSKKAKWIITTGGTLALAVGIESAFQQLKPLPLIIVTAIEKVIERSIEDIVERVARWLVVKWPFQQKGLPFYLWYHEIKPVEMS